MGSTSVENDANAPLGAYGRSKAAGEDGVRHALERHVILRTDQPALLTRATVCATAPPSGSRPGGPPAAAGA